MRIFALFLVLSIPLPAAETLTLADGSKIENATITRTDDEKLYYLTSSGGGSIHLSKLTEDFQKRFDYSAEKAAQIEKEKKRQDARLALYEPYPSEIKRLSSFNPPTKEEAAKLKTCVVQLKLLRAVCDPLLASGQATEDQVRQWASCLSDESIIKGMPMPLVAASWGDPSSKTETSNGYVSWYYSSGFLKGTHITFDNGVVSSWVSMK